MEKEKFIQQAVEKAKQDENFDEDAVKKIAQLTIENEQLRKEAEETRENIKKER